MAAGFTPKHIEDLPLNDLTHEQFLALAIETAKETGLKVGYKSENGFIAYTDNGFFTSNSEIKVKIENGISKIQSASTGNEMIDWGRNEKSVNVFISNFNILKSGLTKEELDTKYQELKDELVSQEEDILKLPPATTTEHIKDFFSIFKPREGFFVTPILIDLNILIFTLMVLSGVNIMLPDNASMINWGANFRPITLEGQWWRLITNCFLHIGIFHLLMNMYALLYIGVLLEPHLGKTRFIAAYLLTGITASIASLWWHDLTISAGASGAIFGMYGVFLAMLTTNLIEKSARKTLLTSILVFVGFNLLNGVKGGIDNAAHIGGLLGGLIIGYAFIPSLKKPEEENLKLSTIGLLVVLVLTSSFAVCNTIPNDIGEYDTQMKEFMYMEKMALEIYHRPRNTPKVEILKEIRDRGIYYWEKNIELIDGFKKLKLPREIKSRNVVIKEYCELRIKSYELLYKAILEDTDKYREQLENYNKEIDSKIKEIAGGQQNK